MSGRQCCAVLASNGFVKVRQRGDHAIMGRRLPDTTVTVPVPLHKELAIGTLRGIIRQSGPPRELFETD